MKLIYDKYESTPIITVVDTNNYPIWNVHFPSVTVCNVNKVFILIDCSFEFLTFILQVYAPAANNITQQL